MSELITKPLALAWAFVFVAVFVWSAWQPKDTAIWVLEVLPAVLAVILILATYARFPLTGLLYFFILVHAVILMIGGHYTYAEVPFFDGLFGMERNNYDKLGHFAQGFVPALAAREILTRNRVVNGRIWTNVISVCICLAFSAFYELIEWWVALIGGDGSVAFLGTQGYVWDTQSDMWWALIGASVAVILLSRFHNRQISEVEASGHVHTT
ncbi:MAG: DUF2238 domain-containing protein [Pseudomonadales bacterium]|nr:DUF2238 domain-containing protein [Pseudomonadales bacterium]